MPGIHDKITPVPDAPEVVDPRAPSVAINDASTIRSPESLDTSEASEASEASVATVALDDASETRSSESFETPPVPGTPTTLASEKPEYDYVVVGGGVAGVLSAEMLRRSGKTVLLMEKEEKIATQSSGEQHGWGQFGYLYLNAEDPGVAEACLQNIDILLNSYPMPGNNLIGDESGELVSENPKDSESWYREDPVYYYYPKSDESSLNLTTSEQEAWQKKLQNVLGRTEAISEQTWAKDVGESSRTLPRDNTERGASLLVAKGAAKKWMDHVAEKNPDGPIAQKLQKQKEGTTVPTDIVIESHDRPMRSTRILTSVHNRFQQEGGETRFGAEIDNYRVNGDVVELSTKKGETITADKVIFTAGGGLHNIEGSNVNTVLSPLLIVSPPVCDRNLVYLTPKSDQTINHLHHVDPVTGKAYSIIGNGDGIKPGDDAAIERSRENILAQAGRIFPKLEDIPDADKTVYFGYKTEFKAPGKERNYHFAFNPIEESEKVWAAVPGKFTLAPSLAKHIYTKLEGTPPPAQAYTAGEAAAYRTSLASRDTPIADTLHSQVVGDRVGSDQYTPEQRAQRSKFVPKSKAESVTEDVATEVDMTERVEAQKSFKAELNQIAERDVTDEDTNAVDPGAAPSH